MAVVIQATLDPVMLGRVQGQLIRVRNGALRATAFAINDVLASARTQITRGVRSEINIKLKSLMRRIKLVKASEKRTYGGLFINEGRPPNLISFGAKQNKKGVTYKIGKSGPRQFIRSAFVNKANGAALVMQRTGAKRYPIKLLPGPSITEFIKQKKIDDTAVAMIREKLPGRIEAQIDRLIEQANR